MRAPVDAERTVAVDGAGARPERWWRAPWRLVVLGMALAFLGGAIGYVVGARSSTDDASRIDVGFAQDMRAHHDQGVAMASMLMAKPLGDGNPTLRRIAQEIVLGQQLEAGGLVQLSRQWGKPEANESGTAMAWMGEPVPLERMPGMATPDNLEELAAAGGAGADQLFVRLMIAHHEGGIHMAEYAADHARVAEVRRFAAAMAANQRSEIVELARYGGAS